MSNVRKYVHYGTVFNQGYTENSIKSIPDERSLESCQIHNNSEILRPPIEIKTVPKWFTRLRVYEINPLTHEIISCDYHDTNDLKAANHRKKMSINKFSDFYEPLYQKKKVTLLFFTFTRMNHARQSFSDMLDNIKYHFKKQLDNPIRGFWWTLEISKNLHAHYHLVIAIDRITIKKMPKALMFEELWGQRTQVQFIKKSVKRYLSKYLVKDSYRVLKMRSYGKSSKFL